MLHTSPMTILVADDDDEMRSFVADAFRWDGCTVIEARDGAELLYRVWEHPFGDGRIDVVVTDVLMPHLSGLGVLSALRHAQPHFPIILITALADASVQTVATRLGAVAVLHKPFAFDELRTAVKTALIARD